MIVTDFFLDLTDIKRMISFSMISRFTGKNSQKEEYMTKKKVLGLGMAALLAGWAVSSDAADEMPGHLHGTAGGPAATAADIAFHGQFRINYYNESQSEGDDTAAARLRWRPTIDARISDDVKMHMQLNIGHIESNASNARYDKSIETKPSASADPAVAIRHAVIDFKLPEVGGNINAGLVPVSDKFGDTLFSGDWDFNPLALVYLGKLGDMDVRLGTGKLQESDSTKYDDTDIHFLDIDLPAGGGSVGASAYQYVQAGVGDTDHRQLYAGIRGGVPVGPANLKAFLLYNTGTKESSVGGKDMDNSGYALKLEGTMPVGPAKVGLMFITASGDKKYGTDTSVDSFITPMALIDHHGYWGYTGKLNIQGPTDTGIDNPVRIDGSTYGGSGLGYGIMTLQAKADFPITDKLSSYIAAGIFQHQDVPSGMDEEIGTDLYAQAKYNLGKNLNIEAGIDYASLPKDNPAYNNVKDNNITLAFARLQLEY